MASIDVAIVNASTVLQDAEVEAAVPALQTQVSRDFAPAWGVDANLVFVPSNGSPSASAWWISILDDSDQAGALGYHDLTSAGLPLGKVFAGTDRTYGKKWTVTASHELLEMLADPDVNLTVFLQQDATTGKLYAYEVCDACEADELSYQIDGVAVSDFVYPAWFESFRVPDGTQFDQRKKLHKPFELLPGGYIGVFDVTGGSGWTQLTASSAHGRAAAPPQRCSRRDRRRIPRDQLAWSDVR